MSHVTGDCFMALASPKGPKIRILYHQRPLNARLNWAAVVYTQLPPKTQNNILCCQRIAGVWCHGIGIPQWLTGTKHVICLMNMNEGEVKMVVFSPNTKFLTFVLALTIRWRLCRPAATLSLWVKLFSEGAFISFPWSMICIFTSTRNTVCW